MATCKHRRFVRDYQSERFRQEMEREAATAGYATEIAEYPPIMTFKKWLTDHAGSDVSVVVGTVEPTPDDWEPPPGF